MARNPHNSIAVAKRGSRLYLQFPRGLFGENQKYVSLNLPDTRDNRNYAGGLIDRMERDRRHGKFDRSLDTYLSIKATEPQKELTLAELWDKYCDYKETDRKPATMHYLRSGIGNHIRKCPHQHPNQALEIKRWLSRRTTPAMTRLVLRSLATVIKWGNRYDLIQVDRNQFLGMAEEMHVDRGEIEPNAFSEDEWADIVEAFENSRYYSFYLPLVKFLRLTGCRPSEAIGLHWEQIAGNFSEIRFDRSTIYVAGKAVHNKKSKTNRIRIFPCNGELQIFLRSLNPSRKYGGLVFSSPTGKPIDYKNFLQRAWRKTVDPTIDRKSTPYSCRDTFITDQIAKGTPIALIAKWCDNSVEMIERYYLDPSALPDIKPR